MRKSLNYWVVVCVLLVFSCEVDNDLISKAGEVPKIHLLKNEQTDYRLQSSIQILKYTFPGYTIQEIIQPSLQDKFQPYSAYTSAIENYQYYWGKLQMENRSQLLLQGIPKGI